MVRVREREREWERESGRGRVRFVGPLQCMLTRVPRDKGSLRRRQINAKRVENCGVEARGSTPVELIADREISLDFSYALAV
jgi:hypothetical protein